MCPSLVNSLMNSLYRQYRSGCFWSLWKIILSLRRACCLDSPSSPVFFLKRQYYDEPSFRAFSFVWLEMFFTSFFSSVGCLFAGTSSIYQKRCKLSSNDDRSRFANWKNWKFARFCVRPITNCGITLTGTIVVWEKFPVSCLHGWGLLLSFDRWLYVLHYCLKLQM